MAHLQVNPITSCSSVRQEGASHRQVTSRQGGGRTAAPHHFSIFNDPSQPGCQRERLRPAQHRAASLSPTAAAEGHRETSTGSPMAHSIPAGLAGSDQRRWQSEGQHPRPARGPVTEGRDRVRGEGAAPPLRAGPAPAPCLPTGCARGGRAAPLVRAPGPCRHPANRRAVHARSPARDWLRRCDHAA